MKKHTYLNDPPKTPYAPAWNFSFGWSTLPLKVDNLALTCLSKEKKIKKLPLTYDERGKYNDGYTGLGKNSTTARFAEYNVLEWDTPETNLLKKYVKIKVREYNKLLGNDTPDYLWARCWVNILRWGQKINAHMHTLKSESYLSAHFTVQADNTSTCYMNPINVLNDPEIISEENVPGVFSIFPSYVPHYTTRHYSFKPRITIAMDIYIENDENRGSAILL